MTQDNGPKHVLVIEDDLDTLEMIEAYLKQNEFRVSTCTSVENALRLLEKKTVDVAVTDLNFLGLSGLDFIQSMKEKNPQLPIILITSKGRSDFALQATSTGAYDFLLKPLNFPQLLLSVQRALHWRSLSNENRVLRQAMRPKGDSGQVIAKSAAFQAVLELCRRVAPSQATVLISGESGTGKEVVAQTIHNLSDRRDKSFVALNCSAIPENLLESELFGHAKGSFTGAHEKKIGLFEEADGGTLFLDEIGDLSLTLQAKLLRVLQERKIKRVGENQDRPVDVRIIAATHKNLAEEVQTRRFREDLFFRLNVIPIRIPPLRERPDDIFPLASHFLEKYSVLNGRPKAGFTSESLHKLSRHSWPGNVRELENTIERAVVLAAGPRIEVTDLLLSSDIEPLRFGPPLPDFVETDTPKGAPNGSFNSEPRSGPLIFGISEVISLEELSRRYIRFVLEKNRGARELTARELEVDRKTLYRKLKSMEGPAPMPKPAQAPDGKHFNQYSQYS